MEQTQAATVAKVRNLMIAAVNDNRTLTIELSTKLDAVLAVPRGAGLMVP